MALDLFIRYLHSNTVEVSDPSSVHRLARVKQLPQPTNSSDILRLLGDTKDTDYPIYRTATPPDTLATLLTGESYDHEPNGHNIYSIRNLKKYCC